jgi:rhodanese-related sulfurtransferase
VARRLFKEGFKKVSVLKDGWYGWKKAGFPVENK